MLPSLSPLSVLNRATQLLARNSWRLFLASLLFEALPGKLVQYALARSFYESPSMPRVWMYTIAAAIFVFSFTFAALRSLITGRLLLDDWEGQNRRFGAVISDGLSLFGRSWWLLIPAEAAGYWLTYYVNVFAGVALSYLSCIFLSCYSLERGSLKESWRISVAMARRHTPLILANILPMSVVSYGIFKSYMAFIRQWQQTSSLELRTLVYILVAPLLAMVFSAWGMAFYGTARLRFRDPQQGTAAVFE